MRNNLNCTRKLDKNTEAGRYTSQRCSKRGTMQTFNMASDSDRPSAFFSSLNQKRLGFYQPHLTRNLRN